MDPRSVGAPHNMTKAVQKWFGDLSENFEYKSARQRAYRKRQRATWRNRSMRTIV